MYEDFFRKRLSALRNNKKVSAREMSISLGQNPGYINSIEMGKTFPSMAGFFYICEYLEISPRDFFEQNIFFPKELSELIALLKPLDKTYIESITNLVKGLNTKNSDDYFTEINIENTSDDSDLSNKGLLTKDFSYLDFDDIFKLLRKNTASVGLNEEQLYNIGIMYRDGIGVPQDYKEAMNWFQMAANKNISK